MCNHNWLHDSYSKVCNKCGLQVRVLNLDVYNANSAPIERGYNRRQRFRVKVDKLLGLHSGPDCDDPVWLHLEKHKVTLNTPFDVRECLRSSGLKNKYYDNIRSFTDAFTTFNIKHSQLDVKRFLLSSFDALYGGWNTCFEGSFFSYAWLLRYFLEIHDSKLVVYLKPKTCKRRNAKYLAKIRTIQSRRNGEIRRCVTLENRSLSEIEHSDSPQTPQCALWDQALKVLQSSVNDHSRILVHLLRAQPNTNSRVTGGILT